MNKNNKCKNCKHDKESHTYSRRLKTHYCVYDITPLPHYEEVVADKEAGEVFKMILNEYCFGKTFIMQNCDCKRFIN